MNVALTFAAFLTPTPAPADFTAFEAIAPPPREVIVSSSPPAPIYREEYRIINGVLYRVLIPVSMDSPSVEGESHKHTQINPRVVGNNYNQNCST